MIWLFKLGGSIITHKRHRTSLNSEAIGRIVREILDSACPPTDTIILVLGAGSFGHVPLQEFMNELQQPDQQTVNQITEDLIGTEVIQTEGEVDGSDRMRVFRRLKLDRLYARFLSSMKLLRDQTIRIVRRTVKKLESGKQRAIVYVSERPILRRMYQTLQDQGAIIIRLQQKIKKHLCMNNRMIVLRGFAHRVASTEEPLVLKLSSDEWILHLAEMLQEQGKEELQMIFVGDVDGLYDHDPKLDPQAQRLDLDRISIEQLEQMRKEYLDGCAHDCTGGIFLKARILKQLQCYGTPHLVDARRRNELRSLINQICGSSPHPGPKLSSIERSNEVRS